ncbi:unnamed protein product [Rhizophagus irregularis]|nr:unnamed protein product [Rhizophagus irregularis]
MVAKAILRIAEGEAEPLPQTGYFKRNSICAEKRRYVGLVLQGRLMVDDVYTEQNEMLLILEQAVLRIRVPDLSIGILSIIALAPRSQEMISIMIEWMAVPSILFGV